MAKIGKLLEKAGSIGGLLSRFDLDQLKFMGGEYIISAVEVINPKRYGLSEVGEYVTDDSYYCLRVYKVE